MKQWQIIAGFCASLVIIGLLLCDDIRTHGDLRACEKAVGLKPDTAVTVTVHPPDSQKPHGVGIHPKNQKPPETGLKPTDTTHPALDTVTQAIPGVPGQAGGNPVKIDTLCIEDTTVFPDSEKIYHRLCSPDLKSTSRITDPWTFRIRPPESTKVITKPVIITRTPWWAHWYIELPIGTALAYCGYRVGKAAAQSQNK